MIPAKFHISCVIPLFHDIEFIRRPRPSPEGKNGPNSVKAPPPREEHPGPAHRKFLSIYSLVSKDSYVNW